MTIPSSTPASTTRAVPHQDRICPRGASKFRGIALSSTTATIHSSVNRSSIAGATGRPRGQIADVSITTTCLTIGISVCDGGD
jgi:hypothetical protein